MATHVPFNQVTHKPKILAGNDKSDTPVEFDLSQLGAPDRMRLQGVILATGALAQVGVQERDGSYKVPWTAELETQCAEAFTRGASIYENGVDAIRHLTIPAAMAVKVGLLAELPATVPKTHPIPITTGIQFARVAPHMPGLAFEIATQLLKLCEEAYIDPRLFEPPSISRGTPAVPNGSARRARRRPGRDATAAGDRKAEAKASS